MTSPFEPTDQTPPPDSGAPTSPYDTPGGGPGAPSPRFPSYSAPPAGYPAQPQGYPPSPQDYPYPYGSYPPYGPYGYPPPAPPRQNNTALWVILSIVGVVVIGVCVACAVLIGVVGNFAGRVAQQYVQPLSVIQTFCQNERDGNYGAVYDQFSSSLQASMRRDDFISMSMARDTSEGTVT